MALDKFDSEEDAIKIQLFGYNMRKLLDKGAAFVENIKQRNCAVHPENRQVDLGILVHLGNSNWDPSALNGAASVELPPNPTTDAYAVDAHEVA